MMGKGRRGETQGAAEGAGEAAPLQALVRLSDSKGHGPQLRKCPSHPNRGLLSVKTLPCVVISADMLGTRRLQPTSPS